MPKAGLRAVRVGRGVERCGAGNVATGKFDPL